MLQGSWCGLREIRQPGCLLKGSFSAIVGIAISLSGFQRFQVAREAPLERLSAFRDNGL
jgi:hypothetical protein